MNTETQPPTWTDLIKATLDEPAAPDFIEVLANGDVAHFFTGVDRFAVFVPQRDGTIKVARRETRELAMRALEAFRDDALNSGTFDSYDGGES